jgi:hypothetical protein
MKVESILKQEKSIVEQCNRYIEYVYKSHGPMPPPLRKEITKAFVAGMVECIEKIAVSDDPVAAMDDILVQAERYAFSLNGKKE